jgi:hypothetical protein
MKTWMRGHLDTEAELSPEESAEGILARIERAAAGETLFDGPLPAYIDVKGNILPW